MKVDPMQKFLRIAGSIPISSRMNSGAYDTPSRDVVMLLNKKDRQRAWWRSEWFEMSWPWGESRHLLHMRSDAFCNHFNWSSFIRCNWFNIVILSVTVQPAVKWQERVFYSSPHRFCRADWQDKFLSAGLNCLKFNYIMLSKGTHFTVVVHSHV